MSNKKKTECVVCVHDVDVDDGYDVDGGDDDDDDDGDIHDD